MNVEEFLTAKKETEKDIVVEPCDCEEEKNIEPEELDVQKVVVEELAADKAKLDEKVEKLSERLESAENELNASKERELTILEENKPLQRDLEETRKALAQAQEKIVELTERQFEEQSRNPNALALLDREVELPDRFPGETRDHVLEVVREARDKAELDGRIRRAQLLEGVLVANEPHGNLAKKRAALEKFFNENANILTGPVLAELDRCGISYKKGDEYLLTSEILKRTY
jgi:regulator of replication initiation timing